jgi:hypothetical protein
VIYLGHVCTAAMWGVSAGVMYWMLDEFIEAGMPEWVDRWRLRILSMAVRKER